MLKSDVVFSLFSYIPSVVEDFDKRDMGKLMTDDHLVNRFIVHVSELASTNAIDNAVNMIVRSFEWRKKTGIAGKTR